MELAKSFEPHAIEAKWYPVWEARGDFKPSYAQGAPAFCIQLPPPNVTGTLHMGHAFQMTLMDVLIRYHRMRGENTLWQLGTDHAGIATQIVVEQQLKAQGESRRDLGREKFAERVWTWKQEPDRRSRRSDGSARPATGRANASRWMPGVRRGDRRSSGCSRRPRLSRQRLVNWDPSLGTGIRPRGREREEQGTLWEILPGRDRRCRCRRRHDAARRCWATSPSR
jgi:valyl-tRNA synthetase